MSIDVSAYVPRLRGYRNLVRRPLYEDYYLEPLKILQGIDFDHPDLSEIREVEHVDLLVRREFRLTVHFVKEVLSSCSDDVINQLNLCVQNLGSFSKFLKRMRNRCGIKQRYISDVSGGRLSQSTYSRIERAMEWPLLLDLVLFHKVMWPKIGMDVHSFIQFAGYKRYKR